MRGASKASAMLRLGAWMGQCQEGQVTQERVSEQERVSAIRSSRRAGVWPLLAWRSERSSPVLSTPVSSRVPLTSAWTLGGALHPVLGSSGPLLGKTAGAWVCPP